MNENRTEHCAHDRIHTELLGGGKTYQYREEVECGIADKCEQRIKIRALFQYIQHARAEHCHQHLEHRSCQHRRDDRRQGSGQTVHDRRTDGFQGQRFLLCRCVRVFLNRFLFRKAAEITDFLIDFVYIRADDNLILLAGTVDTENTGNLFDCVIVGNRIVFQVEAQSCNTMCCERHIVFSADRFQDIRRNLLIICHVFLLSVFESLFNLLFNQILVKHQSNGLFMLYCQSILNLERASRFTI